ncbi:hypothetical protein D4764_0142850 [Takifugu flavidus]|uniref:Uncharacterized protein n=1 Tax=Takifugu flavidus TaxID=433684 RepID=A0A5C6MEU3_9TELE|nr:hypothetical protein D4764_0142850 [Takifugu flavidus]
MEYAGLRLIWAVRPTETVSQRELSGSAKKVGASSRLERFAVRARALVCTGQLADVSGSRCPSGNPHGVGAPPNTVGTDYLALGGAASCFTPIVRSTHLELVFRKSPSPVSWFKRLVHASIMANLWCSPP